MGSLVGLLPVDFNDETGEVITELQDRVLRWKYRKLLPVTDDSQAKWAMAKPENYTEFASRTKQLDALKESFKKADTREELCRIYDEASQIRRFYGSDAYFSMRRSLDSCCRQTDGYVSTIFDSDTSDADVREMMRPFTPKPWDLPISLQKRLEKTRWVTMPIILNPEGERALFFGKNQPLSYKNPYTGESLFTTVAGPPRGEGLYLLDARTEKMYFVRNMSPAGSARFSRGSRLIISRERISGPGSGSGFGQGAGQRSGLGSGSGSGQGAGQRSGLGSGSGFGQRMPMSFLTPMSPIKDVYGCTDSTMDGRFTRTLPKEYSGNGLHVVSGFPGSASATGNAGFMRNRSGLTGSPSSTGNAEQELKTLIWDNGAFVFPDAESYSAFADQPGRFEILDAREDCGLIAYKFESRTAGRSSQRFRLWSIDESRNVLDVEAPTFSFKAAFSSPGERDVRIMVYFAETRFSFDYNRVMLGMAANDPQMMRDNLQSRDMMKNARIYQFTCSYAPLPSKRNGAGGGTMESARIGGFGTKGTMASDPSSPAALPRIGLEECGWDGVIAEKVKPRESESALVQKLNDLRSKRSSSPADLSQIHIICCELADRFPNNASYARDKEAAENELTKRFKKLTSLFGKDIESLKQYCC